MSTSTYKGHPESESVSCPTTEQKEGLKSVIIE